MVVQTESGKGIAMEIVQLCEALGSELRDVDITQPLTADEIARARQSYDETYAIVVRGQALTRDQMARLCSYFWPPQRASDGSPNWTIVSNRGDDAVVRRTGNGVLLFHTDQLCSPQPAVGQTLYAHEVTPPVAPTCFANGVRAARQLPSDLRSTLSARSARHVLDFHCTEGDVTYRMRERDLPVDAPASRFERHSHPVFYPVDERGTTSLLLSEQMTSHIEGMDPDESEEVLQECFTRLYDAENVYQHEWRPHDIVVWNALALQHGRPKLATSGVREFWRLKSYAVPGSAEGSDASTPDAYNAWLRDQGSDSLKYVKPDDITRVT